MVADAKLFAEVVTCNYIVCFFHEHDALPASQLQVLQNRSPHQPKCFMLCLLVLIQVTSNEVAARVAEAEATEAEIDATRELYRPVASRTSLLFFAISELAGVDPMYQYSLAWFAALFIKGIQEAPKVCRNLAAAAHATCSKLY
jgi:hypothetical protein